MKRHILLLAVGFVVGCSGAPVSEEELLREAAVEDRAGYTACGRFSCVPGFEATFIHLEACEPASAGLNATECTAVQAGRTRSEEVDADKPPEPIKRGQDVDADKPPEPIK